ncbi:glutathione S-transferase family protein [Polycladidibacter stylochi]|uniref:glutathione S-transferase family protein n=1 Tax=Polycladidibacter stylochi TaxID=1807766 RepID=UPI000830BF77|nr:glutathione S-transferase N-terminal domain-containing protein [Pseudovibrio stylochi]
MLKLYSAIGSNSSERVEWVLQYKHLDWERVEVSNEELANSYRQFINPFGFVPALDHNGFILSESMAIIEYLEELHPSPSVFGENTKDRAQICSICSYIGTTIHSPQNRSVLRFFRPELSPKDKKTLRATWIAKGLEKVAPLLWGHSGFCYGHAFSLSDIFVATIYRKYLQHGATPLPAYEEHRRFLLEQDLIPTNLF